MNPVIDRLAAYPFERLKSIVSDVVPSPSHAPIDLGLGEPRHAAPDLVRRALAGSLDGLSRYPATVGERPLREAAAAWIARRHGVAIDPATELLPVNGTREALFALAQAVVDRNRNGAIVVCPNPFYAIYEGAAMLAGAEPAFANADPARRFAIDWASIPDEVWARTQLVYVCSPGNPTGAVASLDEWRRLFALSDRHGFVIASDECYSEIHFDDAAPPLGALAAAAELGRRGFPRLVMLSSLSKRSSVPGLRSGFVAGDAAVIAPFLRYRTFHGSAMSPVVQAASAAAWRDEAHVIESRDLYRLKFSRVLPMLSGMLDVAMPDAGFYLWAGVPGGDDLAFARGLLAEANVTVLPGSLLAREAHGRNPGAGRIRIALVAPPDECEEAARRIAAFAGTFAADAAHAPGGSS